MTQPLHQLVLHDARFTLCEIVQSHRKKYVAWLVLNRSGRNKAELNNAIRHVTTKSATARDRSLWQHRLIWLKGTHRLARTALHPLTHATLSLGYKAYHIARELDDQGRQVQMAQAILPDFLQRVLPRVASSVRTRLVDPTFLVAPIRNSGVFDTSCEAGCPKQPTKQENRGDLPVLGGPPCMETHLLYAAHRLKACKEKLESMTPRGFVRYSFHSQLEKLFVWPLLKLGPAAEEFLVCRCEPMVAILSCRELKSANIVCNLRETVLGSSCGAVYNRTFEENEINRFMQGVCNGTLPTIVVNLYLIKCLEAAEIIEEELNELLSHSTRHVFLRFEFFHPELKQPIANRQVSHKYSKRSKQPTSSFKRESLVSAVSSHKGRCMKRNVRHVPSYQTLLVKANRIANARILIMKYQGEQVIGLSQVIAARLIDKDTQLCHTYHSKKKAGENVPGTWRPLREENHLIYTTCRFVHSIISNFEHMFSIIETNTRSTYRKAA